MAVNFGVVRCGGFMMYSTEEGGIFGKRYWILEGEVERLWVLVLDPCSL